MPSTSRIRDRIRFVLRFAGLRALVGGVLALAVLHCRIDCLECVWAKIYCSLDSRSAYVYESSSLPPPMANDATHGARVRIATRLSPSSPEVSQTHLSVFTVECTGVSVVVAVAPFLVSRWRLGAVLIGALAATLLTGVVNLFRLWLDYRLMSPSLPYSTMHDCVSTLLFGLEMTVCVLFALRVAWVRCAPATANDACSRW